MAEKRANIIIFRKGEQFQILGNPDRVQCEIITIFDGKNAKKHKWCTCPMGEGNQHYHTVLSK